MVKQETKNKWHRLELLTVTCLVLVLGGVFLINQTDFSKLLRSDNIITGFVSSDVITQDLNLEIGQSQEFLLATESSFKLTSLRLAGAVEGQGIIQVFLEDAAGQRFLVYTNVKEKSKNNLVTGMANEKAGNLVTGMAIAETASIDLEIKPSKTLPWLESKTAENQEITKEPFYNICLDSCFISVDFSSGQNNKLVFQLSKGTKVKISQLAYTIGE